MNEIHGKNNFFVIFCERVKLKCYQLGVSVSRLSFSCLALLAIFSLARCNGDTCSGNEILEKGKYLESSNGKYRLKLKVNGNLEIFCGNISVWKSKTISDNVKFLYFDLHGNVVLYGKDNSIVWSPGIGKNAEKLIMQDDGNVVLYKSDGQSVWATETKDKCHSDGGLKLSFHKTKFEKSFFMFYLILLAPL